MAPHEIESSTASERETSLLRLERPHSGVVEDVPSRFAEPPEATPSGSLFLGSGRVILTFPPDR